MTVDKPFGTVETGKEADLVVVDGDPLTNVSAIRDVRMVMKAGEVVGEMELLSPDPRLASVTTTTETTTSTTTKEG